MDMLIIHLVKYVYILILLANPLFVNEVIQFLNKNKKLLTNRKKLCIIVKQTKLERFASIGKWITCGSTQEAVRGVPAKDVGRVPGAEVRIFSPTPKNPVTDFSVAGFFLLAWERD